MARIKIEVFGGIKPRAARRLGPESTASVAHNVKLWHGTVAPWRQPREVTTDDTCIRSMRMVNCGFLTDINPCASFAASGEICDRVYGTQICGHDCPVTAKLPSGCSPTVISPVWTRLGVPVGDPLTIDPVPLTPAVSNVNSPVFGEQIKREQRNYVYTYVNSYGEEGSPSPAVTTGQDAFDADAVVTVNFPNRPAVAENWDIVAIRLYRGVSGAAGPDEGVDALFLFVDEIDISAIGPNAALSYEDSIPVDELGEEVTPRGYLPPPCDLKGITELQMGGLVGYEGKRLHFSEPFHNYAWPCWIDLDYCIKGVVEVDNMLYVATDGKPYLISSVPNVEECKCCRSVVRVEEPAAMVSDHRGMVGTYNGAIWPTKDGLVRMTGASVSLITHSEAAEDDWLGFFPANLIAASSLGRYYGFSQNSFVFDYTDGVYADGDVGAGSRWSTLSYQPTALATSKNGQIFMAFNDQIRQWDDGAEFEVFRWRTKLLQSMSLISWSAARIFFEQARQAVPVRFSMIDEDGREVFSRTVRNNRPFRLPRLQRGRAYEFQIEGVSEVSGMFIATSVRELAD